MKYFCKSMNRMSVGMTVRKPAAVNSPYDVPDVVDKLESVVATGYVAVRGINTSAQSMSL